MYANACMHACIYTYINIISYTCIYVCTCMHACMHASSAVIKYVLERRGGPDHVPGRGVHDALGLACINAYIHT